MGYAKVYDQLTPKHGELLARIVALAEQAGDEPLLMAKIVEAKDTLFIALVRGLKTRTVD